MTACKPVLVSLALWIVLAPAAPAWADSSSEATPGLPLTALRQSVDAAQEPGLSAAGLKVTRHRPITAAKIALFATAGFGAGVGGVALGLGSPPSILFGALLVAAAASTAWWGYNWGNGVAVQEIRPGSVVQPGLRTRDVITNARIGETRIRTLEPKDLDLALQIGQIRNKTVALDVRRDGQTIMLYINIDQGNVSGVQQMIERIR
ncbi:MAG: hypothetical protein HYY16_15310 [Planctomycetes bacterium]|nr:hypothetical protein [Planctomycetota bacterium]